jgi:hypothetical protein
MVNEPHHARLRAIEPHRAFTVLLSAWPPGPERRERPGQATATERHDAIVGIARAVFALGAELVVPADPDTAPVVAAVALDYATPPAAERGEPAPSPLSLMETERPEPELRAMMTPYIALGGVRYLDPDGEVVAPDPVWATRRLESLEHVRHAVTDGLVEAMRPRVAVFVSATASAERDMSVLDAHGVPIAVLSSTVDDPVLAERWSSSDPTEYLLREGRRGRWTERAAGEDPFGAAPSRLPYGYIVQRLILDWYRGAA